MSVTVVVNVQSKMFTESERELDRSALSLKIGRTRTWIRINKMISVTTFRPPWTWFHVILQYTECVKSVKTVDWKWQAAPTKSQLSKCTHTQTRVYLQTNWTLTHTHTQHTTTTCIGYTCSSLSRFIVEFWLNAGWLAGWLADQTGISCSKTQMNIPPT